MRPYFCTNRHVKPTHERSEVSLPVLIGAGRLRTNFVVPPGIDTACRPFDGDTAYPAWDTNEVHEGLSGRNRRGQGVAERTEGIDCHIDYVV
jgi:hypothetical protein